MTTRSTLARLLVLPITVVALSLTLSARSGGSRWTLPGGRQVPHTTNHPATNSVTGEAEGPSTCAALDGFQALPGGRRMLVTAASTRALRPAVIMLHGYTATPAGEEAVSGWTSLMARTDVLVAYPQGSPTPYGGYGWTTGAARFATTGTNDVADIDNALTALVTEDCVNPKEVMIAGESNGSGLGLILGCDHATARRVRLFALAIPAVDRNVLARCRRALPFPLLVIASLHDATVSYDGTYPPGVAPFSAPLTWFEQVATTVDRCVGLHAAGVPDGWRYSYRRCAEPATFYVALDGHHTWPGGPQGAGGLDPGRFPAAKLAWCTSGLTSSPAPVACRPLLAAYGPRGALAR